MSLRVLQEARLRRGSSLAPPPACVGSTCCCNSHPAGCSSAVASDFRRAPIFFPEATGAATRSTAPRRGSGARPHHRPGARGQHRRGRDRRPAPGRATGRDDRCYRGSHPHRPARPRRQWRRGHFAGRRDIPCRHRSHCAAVSARFDHPSRQQREPDLAAQQRQCLLPGLARCRTLLQSRRSEHLECGRRRDRRMRATRPVRSSAPTQGMLGDVRANYFYLVRAFNGDATWVDSGQVGAFNFALQPGN